MASVSLLGLSESSLAFPQRAQLLNPDSFLTSLGKVAIVTGSSRSIGAAIAKGLGEQGATVIVNYVNDAKSAEEVVRSIRISGKGDAIAVKADVSTIDGGKYLVEETIKLYGKLDILVLNAGIMGSKPLEEVDEAFFDRHMQINVKVPLFLAKAATEYLPTRESSLTWSAYKFD